MSDAFLFAACPVPLAQYITINTNDNNNTTSYRYIAPEKAWEKPFRHWLSHTDTANAIMNKVDINDYLPSYFGWGNAVVDYALDNNLSCATELEFAKYCKNLNSGSGITHDVPQYYAHVTTQCISSRFMNAARNVFSNDNAEGVFHKGEFFTGGTSWNNVPTEIFDNVSLLSDIDFFNDFPIATIVNGIITDWQDKDGESINPPAGFDD